MTASVSAPASGNAQALAREFDDSFARPPSGPLPRTHEFVLVRAGGISHAVPVGDIAALVEMDALVPCPGSAAAFVGLAAVRGAVVPVYDLAALAGAPAATGMRLLLPRAAPVALRFDGFEGRLRARQDELVTGVRDGAVTAVRGRSGATWPVLALPPLLEAVRRHASAAPTAPASRKDRHDV